MTDKKTILINLKHRLATLQGRMQLNQAQLVKKLHIKQPYLSKLLRGKQMPNALFWVRLEDMLNLQYGAKAKPSHAAVRESPQKSQSPNKSQARGA